MEGGRERERERERERRKQPDRVIYNTCTVCELLYWNSITFVR